MKDHYTKDSENLVSKAEELAKAHWSYVKSIIEMENIGLDDIGNLPIAEYIKRVELHYVTAFIHGYKHGKEAETSTDNRGIDFTWLTNLSSGKTFEPSDTIKEIAAMDQPKREAFVKAFNEQAELKPDYETWYKQYGIKIGGCPVCGGTLTEGPSMKSCDASNCSWDTWKRYQMIFCED